MICFSSYDESIGSDDEILCVSPDFEDYWFRKRSDLKDSFKTVYVYMEVYWDGARRHFYYEDKLYHKTNSYPINFERGRDGKMDPHWLFMYLYDWELSLWKKWADIKKLFDNAVAEVSILDHEELTALRCTVLLTALP